MNNIELVTLFDHKNYMNDTINLLNEEWPKSVEFRRRSLEKYCQKSAPHSLLLLQNEVLIGHARFLNVCNYGDGKAAYLESLVIRKCDRGKGFGKILVGKCVEKAREEGYKVVILCTFDQMPFYEKSGFHCCEFLQISTMPIETCVSNCFVINEIKPMKCPEIPKSNTAITINEDASTPLVNSNGANMPILNGTSTILSHVDQSSLSGLAGAAPPAPPGPKFLGPKPVTTALNKEIFMFLYL